MQHNKKHCPAVIGIYYYVDGIKSSTEIGRIIGISTSTVHRVLKSKYGASSPREIKGTDEVIDAIEREYLAGASTYQLGDKYGVHHATISKWMARRGHYRGKGWFDSSHSLPEQSALAVAKGAAKGHETKRKKAIDKRTVEIEKLTDGTISLVSYENKYDITLKCNICGCVFKKLSAIRGSVPRCPDCYEKELREKERRKRDKTAAWEAKQAVEYKKDKVCESCGSVFHSSSDTAKFCSSKCRKREHDRRYREKGKGRFGRGSHCHRARHYGVAYEYGITLKKVIERDGNVCQICGRECDSSDLRWGTCGPLYPTIDHITAMANGGGHTWGNVQLAHAICNSLKRDLTDEEMAEEVKRHAEKQTA